MPIATLFCPSTFAAMATLLAIVASPLILFSLKLTSLNSLVISGYTPTTFAVLFGLILVTKPCVVGGGL